MFQEIGFSQFLVIFIWGDKYSLGLSKQCQRFINGKIGPVSYFQVRIYSMMGLPWWSSG